MMSIVELDDPGPAGADSTGLAVWFMVGACVRLNEVAGYRRRARSLQELVGNRKRLNRQRGTCGLSRRVYGRENKHDGEASCLLYPQEALPACSGLMGWDASYEEDAQMGGLVESFDQPLPTLIGQPPRRLPEKPNQPREHVLKQLGLRTAL
jgi:hypothetical protein